MVLGVLMRGLDGVVDVDGAEIRVERVWDWTTCRSLS
jgi:hypothetical protein